MTGLREKAVWRHLALFAALLVVAPFPACIGARSGVTVSDAGVYNRQDMTLAEAQKFSEYPVYYAGDQYTGQRVDAVLHRTAYGPSVHKNSVMVIYWPDGVSKRAGDSGGITIVTERTMRADLERWTEINRRLPPTGVLRSDGYDDFWMHLFIGDVLVTISGRSAEEVLRARQALKPLNLP